MTRTACINEKIITISGLVICIEPYTSPMGSFRAKLFRTYQFAHVPGFFSEQIDCDIMIFGSIGSYAFGMLHDTFKKHFKIIENYV